MAPWAWRSTPCCPPAPRYLANCQEIAVICGALVGGITAFADGPEEMWSS
ncbi:hypothetical protein ACIREM_40680 [Streptomyces shenzhenensis]